MTVKEALYQASKALASAGIEDARLEAELLLMHILYIDRARLYVRLNDQLSSSHTAALSRDLKRRLRHEPLAYILGHREFYGRDFLVGPGVLIPRPETELLVEKALALVEGQFARRNAIIADIGTGCGAIAVSLALLLPEARIYATDISPGALDTARLNCEKHGVQERVRLLQGNLLEPLPEATDIIVANLPYIRDEEVGQLSPEIRLFEPLAALAGGKDGLDVIRQLLAQAGGKMRPGGVILLEIGYGQAEAAVSLAKSFFPKAVVELAKDLAGIDRVVTITSL